MAVVFGTVNSHNGLIRVVSEPGKGASFRVLIPSAISHAKPENRRQLPPTTPDVEDEFKPIILVVDDEHSVLDLAKTFLSTEGWNVLVSDGGQDAIEIIRRHQHEIKCMLLDVIMPEFEAQYFLDWLRENRITIPVVLMSGFGYTQLGDFNQDPMVTSVLAKPFSLNELAVAVEKAAESEQSKTLQLRCPTDEVVVERINSRKRAQQKKGRLE